VTRDAPVYITAHVRAKPGAFAQLMALAKGLVRANRAEPGCLYYALHTSAEAADTLLMYEIFVSAAAFDEHLASTHVREFRHASTALVEEPLRTTRWDCIGEPPALAAGSTHVLRDEIDS
jgi:quinol monooxygenase YgiN